MATTKKTTSKKTVTKSRKAEVEEKLAVTKVADATKTTALAKRKQPITLVSASRSKTFRARDGGSSP